VTDTDEGTAQDKVTDGTAARPNLTYSGDINGVPGLNIFDAQVAFDLSRGSASAYYTDTSFTTLSVAQRLEADVTGDGTLDSADARAIQWFYHYGNWNVPE
jgi:hypothetical protein